MEHSDENQIDREFRSSARNHEIIG